VSTTISIQIDGVEAQVQPGTSVAAAILNNGQTKVRKSVRGEPRGPVCGMGICYECRASIDGVRHVRSCMVQCVDGMVIETDA
jgi:D-hydroxyproline dehydrogenase subunit gamma